MQMVVGVDQKKAIKVHEKHVLFPDRDTVTSFDNYWGDRYKCLIY